MLESLDAQLATLLETGETPITACTAVFRKHNGHIEVLVGLRKADPFRGQWALPGGHGDKGETPEQAARRELQEETGVVAPNLTFVRSSRERRDAPKKIMSSPLKSLQKLLSLQPMIQEGYAGYLLMRCHHWLLMMTK